MPIMKRSTTKKTMAVARRLAPRAEMPWLGEVLKDMLKSDPLSSERNFRVLQDLKAILLAATYYVAASIMVPEDLSLGREKLEGC